MRLIDSHSHLFLEEFAGDLPQAMARVREAGVTHIFMPNIDSTTIKPMLRVCREFKVVVEGFTLKGELIRGEVNFHVKK